MEDEDDAVKTCAGTLGVENSLTGDLLLSEARAGYGASARRTEAVRAAARSVDTIMWRRLVRPLLPREAWGTDYGAE